MKAVIGNFQLFFFIFVLIKQVNVFSLSRKLFGEGKGKYEIIHQIGLKIIMANLGQDSLVYKVVRPCVTLSYASMRSV